MLGAGLQTPSRLIRLRILAHQLASHFFQSNSIGEMTQTSPHAFGSDESLECWLHMNGATGFPRIADARSALPRHRSEECSSSLPVDRAISA